MFKKTKLLSIILALVMVMSLFSGLAVTANAATTDPYIAAFDDNLDWHVVTFTLTARDTEAYFFVSPCAIKAPDAPPTFFSSASDAENVELSVILDSLVGISYAEVDDSWAFEYNPGQYLLYVHVTLANDATFGSVSVQILNLNVPLSEDAVTGVTIVRNEAPTPTYTSVGGIDIRVIDPATDLQVAGGIYTVNSNDFYEYYDRSFPNPLDGLTDVDTAFGLHYDPEFYPYSYYPNGDYFLFRMTVPSGEYDTSDYKGWQYRVYRWDGGRYAYVPLSDYVSITAFKLAPGDVVLWKYGEYDLDRSLFPTTL